MLPGIWERKPLKMSDTNYTFGQALSRLEQIVDKLNQQNIELEEAMTLFKEGLALSRQCQNQLDHFEKEVRELIVENQGEADE